MWNFNQIGETSSLEWLKRDEESKVPIDVLEKTYSKMLIEYRDATIKMGKNSQILNVQKQILKLKIKYDVIMIACSNLTVMNRDEESEKILANCGFMIDENTDMTPQLIKIGNASKNLKTQWLIKEAEFAKLNTSEKSTSNFDQYVERISDIKKYYVDPKKKTVRQWLAIEMNLLEDQRNKTQNNG
jgi:hypothetical protein